MKAKLTDGQKIALAIIIGVGVIGSIAFGNHEPKPLTQEQREMERNGGLTDAQLLEIAEFCRDNPNSWRC